MEVHNTSTGDLIKRSSSRDLHRAQLHVGLDPERSDQCHRARSLQVFLREVQHSE